MMPPRPDAWWQTLVSQASRRPMAPALRQGDRVIRYGELLPAIAATRQWLEGERFGLLLDNHPAWAVLDLALLTGGKLCVPLPPFFSPGQLRHSIADAGLDRLITDRPDAVAELCGGPPAASLQVAGRELALFRLAPRPRTELPANLVKITYTSGTTGNPKGVCLSWEAMQPVVGALAQAAGASSQDRALALLPLSTLLENIGSLYLPLQAGAECCLPSLAETGLSGSSGLNAMQLHQCLAQYRPSGLILIPQLLQALVELAENGLPAPDSLRFAAVGGAPVAAGLLARAHAQGLPVFQGYGLSEAASVVTLNRPDDNRPGSVGRPLPHIGLRIADDGEILLTGRLFSGYLPQVGAHPLANWASGDLGYLDQDGYLYLTGRKREVFITSFGRNLSPAWVEAELQAQPAIAQAAVFGEARPFNVAVIVARPGADRAAVDNAVTAVNTELPDYARVRRYLIAEQAFTPGNGLATATGRLRRRPVELCFRHQFEAIYREETR